MSLTYGELFAGYGGLGLGVQSVLGGDMAWYAEFDKAPSAIMAHHYPDLTNYGDVTKVDWASVPRVDVITGGSPCQDLSHAGKRAGMKAGTRSGLWASMCDAIDIIRPRLVVWENVQGALSAAASSALMPSHFDDSIRWHQSVATSTRSESVRKAHRRSADRLLEHRARRVGTAELKPVLRALGRVLGDLAELGYDAWWYGLRAADVGAAHGRFRIFVYATPANAIGGGWDGWALDAIRRPIERATPAGGGEVPDGLTLLPTPVTNDMGAGKTVDAWDAWTEAMQSKHGNGNGHGKSLAIEAQRLLGTPRCADGMQHDLRDGVENPRGRLEDQVSLLPTPRATRGGSASETRDLLLPTPRATDGTKGGPNQRGSSGDLMLPSAVQRMLPTPNAGDAKQGYVTREQHDARAKAKKAANPNLGDLHEDLPLIAQTTQDWREYEAAIRRQEAAFGRPAPLPTEPGSKGQPRLSPAFVEWLMGLPEGHVTDVLGVSRNDQLKALGNGVMPQQAAAATRAFLTDMAKAGAA